MPAKKQVKKVVAKKEVLKKEPKKVVAKTVKKVVAKKAPVAAKTVASTVKTKEKTETNFSLMNAVAIIVVVAIIAFVAFIISGKSNPTSIKQVKSVASVNYDCNAGQNALTLLKDSNKVETQDSSYGVFVDSINAQANTNDSFWIFYVNGEMGAVAPDQYTCKNGDKIEWRFEKIL